MQVDTFEVVTRGHRAQLAEGPIWSDRENAVYWVDIMGRSVHRMLLEELSTRSWPMPDMIGWVIERQSRPGFIAGLAGGFAEVSLEPFGIRMIGDPEPELPNNRMNDAKVDAAGRIWAGTMDADAAQPTGALYRFDPDHTWHKQDRDYLVTNGPAFSPDGTKLYHTDSHKRVIYCFDLQSDGTLLNKRPFVTFKTEWGYPDGMTADAEGGLWVAHWGAARVSRFSPEGHVVRVIELPTSQPTSCVFAGKNLDRMFITSAACDCLHEELAGEIFEIDPGVCGVPAVRFAG